MDKERHIQGEEPAAAIGGDVSALTPGAASGAAEAAERPRAATVTLRPRKGPPTPDDTGYPGWLKALIIVGGSALLWLVLLVLARAILHWG